MNTHSNRLTASVGAGLAVIAFACALAAPAGAVLSASGDTTEHNARVAEYLMQSQAGQNEHNARVAEYLLQEDRAD